MKIKNNSNNSNTSLCVGRVCKGVVKERRDKRFCKSYFRRLALSA